MRTFLLVLTFAAATALASAEPATITLINGKTYERAEITAQTAEHVTVRYAGGIAQIEKRMLPEDLRAKYPIDEKTAAAERDRRERDAARAEARADRRQERAESRHDEQAARATNAAQSREIAAENLEAQLTAEAQRRARTYFSNKRWGSGSELSVTVNVEMDVLEPVQGWPNRYRVTGLARVQFYESSARSFSKREQRFEVLLQTDDRGRVKTCEVTEH